MLIRLDKYLADMQVGTRSEVKELIRKKRVTVNDNIVTKPESKINTDGDSQRRQKYTSNRGKADGRKGFDSICLRKGIPPGAVQWAEVFQSQPVGNVYG